MADINPSLPLQNHNPHPVPASLDPQSLILSQFSDSQKPQLLRLTTEGLVMKRGPRFREYSDLRERKLRMMNLSEQQNPEKETDEKVQIRSVLKKQVKFSSDFTTPPRRPKVSSVLTQSVPDFSSALRKENRKPAAALPHMAERSVTPPTGFSQGGRVYGKTGWGGSKSTNSAEKRSGGLMARTSDAKMEELKKVTVAAGQEINGRRTGRGGGNKTVLGNRLFS